MANFSMKGGNCTLLFKGNGQVNTASVRVSRTAYTYGVNSTQSHARLDKAFYPHRRALGQFTLTVDAIGYKEHRNFQNWLRLYAEAMFSGQMGNQKGATTMEVRMPARNIHRVGILVAGIDDHDHIGSMVFSPTLTFMLLKDFNDSGTAIVSTGSTSQFIAPSVQNVVTGGTKNKVVTTINDRSGTSAFYPVTVSSYKDMDSSIYDFTDPTISNDVPDPIPVQFQPGHGHISE